VTAGPVVEVGRALAVAALDLHAGDTLQRLGRVGVGQLADILRLDRVDDLVGIALDRLGGAKALAHAGDDDVLVADRCLGGLIGGQGLGRLRGRLDLRHRRCAQQSRHGRTTQQNRADLHRLIPSLDRPAHFVMSAYLIV
jgi:hypothetical protein